MNLKKERKKNSFETPPNTLQPTQEQRELVRNYLGIHLLVVNFNF